jgi:stage II sporulation protein D
MIGYKKKKSVKRKKYAKYHSNYKMLKQPAYYMLLILVAVIILPILIVRTYTNQNESPTKDQKQVVMVKVYIASEKVSKTMPLEDYIKGVVAAEMPAEFDIAALKAQAVAARTYVYGRMKGLYKSKNNTHAGSDVCTDPAHCQAWISKETAKKNWGIIKYYKYWNKICKAVDDTKNIIITYNNTIINPLFHSNSGGMTENVEDVWDCDPVPYLRSVQSDGEDVVSGYKTVNVIKITEFVKKMKEQYKDIKLSSKNIMNDIKILNYTEGERVKTIKIGNITLKGTDIRTIFSLKSANFTIEQFKNDSIAITTKGNGHGVGMSQWGANYLAKGGNSYETILKYYYTGIKLGKITFK